MNSNTRNYALACFAVAAAWPVVAGRLTALMMSPIDRAMRDAWCGAPMHGQFELLGHCFACWVGSALFAALGIVLLTTRAPATHRAAARNASGV